MSKIRIIAVVFLVCLLVLTSCNNPKTAETVITKTESELTKVKSYQLDTDFIYNSGSAEWKGTKVVNVADKQMGMNMIITMGLSFPLHVTNEMYFMDGIDYLKTISEENSPQTAGWSRRKLVDDIWNRETQLLVLPEFLKSPSQIGALETKQFNNIGCYVLTITPTAQASVDFVLSVVQPGGPSFDAGGVGDTLVRTDAFSSGSAKLWIDKNNYLPIKVEVNIKFHGSLTDSFGSSIIYDESFEGDLNYSRYNQPVFIQIPQEALDSPFYGN